MNNEASLFCNSIHQNSNPNFHQQKNYLFSHTFSKFMLFIQPKPFVKLQEEEILFPSHAHRTVTQIGFYCFPLRNAFVLNI